MSVVSVVSCDSYEIRAVRTAVKAVLSPLGGITRFVRPGMKVLIKPNLLSASDPSMAITTHPAIVRAVVEMTHECGAMALVGDSPGGSSDNVPRVWSASGMLDVADQTGARMVPFDGVDWKRVGKVDYFIARPIFDVDLVINLPKLKTHMFTLYTGAVKNLFGAIPGTRKRQVHYQAPAPKEFSVALVDVLELIQPGLHIMDGILGQEGPGPGASGVPRMYGCISASVDPIALDAVLVRSMGGGRGAVLHLAEAAARGLGEDDPAQVRLEGDLKALDFGQVDFPGPRWYLRLIPSWLGGPVSRAAKLRPSVQSSACTACESCVEVCPVQAITVGEYAIFDLNTCVGCLCCAEICPQGCIEAKPDIVARVANLRR
jgi:uncharacterized protein (DUF362 family)/Pyruvate/2-oxoacid:ferredoxin oxidoreductase delta subunit